MLWFERILLLSWLFRGGAVGGGGRVLILLTEIFVAGNDVAIFPFQGRGAGSGRETLPLLVSNDNLAGHF